MKNYVPEIVGNGKYVKFLLLLDECHKCKRPMVARPKEAWGTFPHYRRLTFSAQAEAAGLVVNSSVKVDDRPICTECVGAGRADFLCALCQKRKSTDKIREQFGDPPEFLCVDCYGSVTAREWGRKVNELHDRHRFDFR